MGGILRVVGLFFKRAGLALWSTMRKLGILTLRLIKAVGRKSWFWSMFAVKWSWGLVKRIWNKRSTKATGAKKAKKRKKKGIWTKKMIAELVGYALVAVGLIILGNWMSSSITDWFTLSFQFQWKYLWWGLGGLVAVSLIVWLVTRVGTVRMPAASLSWFSWPIVLGIGGFLLCHWLLMEGFPTFYTKWRYSDAFIPMNVALLAIAVLMGQKHTALRVVRTALIVLVVLIGFRELLGNYKWPSFSTDTPVRTTASRTLTTSLPADVVLPIIAQCESGGRQFEDDGVTPLRNREGSSAFGKYQFLESHREPAQKLGFDLNTEEGQDGYARHLYGLSGTQHWEADPRSRRCWSTRLIQAGRSPLPSSEIEYTTTLSSDQPLAEIMPVGWRMDWWGNPNEFDTRHSWRGQNKVRHFTIKAGVESTELRVRVYPCSPDTPC